MADIYVDSNATGGSQTGADWANAYLTLAAAAAVDNAGDTIWVAHNHSESGASGTWAFAGTVASPVRVLCASSGSGEPPSTLAATGVVNVSSISITSGVVHFYGVIFEITGGNFSSAGGNQIVCEACTFDLQDSGAGRYVGTSVSNNSKMILKDCSWKFANSGSGLLATITQSGNSIVVEGGAILSGGTAITQLINSISVGSRMEISGVDISQAASTLNIVNTLASHLSVVLRDCKLPSSWSGALQANSGDATAQRLSMHNCASGDTNYSLDESRQFGTIVHETTLVKSGGASDGTTSIAWEMTTNANAEWSHQTLDSPEIMRWNERVGQPVKIAVDILHDSLTNLQNDEIWLEVQYLGTSGFPLSSFIDDAAATYTSTPADQETSSATWTTTGLTNPNEQQLSVIFTPQEAGYFIAKVKLAKASYTVYVDPRLQVGVS